MNENLIFVNTGHDNEIWDEKTDESISTQTADVGPNYWVDLANKGLDKTIQTSDL